jgi:hypothetical protein
LLGSGSDRRRKNLITGRFGARGLFEEHRRECRKGFEDIAGALEDQLLEAVEEQVELVRANLQVLRDENVVLESERDPGFRRRVGAEMERVMGQVEELGRVVQVEV